MNFLRNPIEELAMQVSAKLLAETTDMDASGRAVVLGKVLARVAANSQSSILTPRSIAFIAHQHADQLIMEAMPC